MGDMPDDALLAARRVSITKLALYASPGYTTLRGLPEHPDDLARHDLLCLPRKGRPAMISLLKMYAALVVCNKQFFRIVPPSLISNSS
jgi:hypothetical protein